MTPTNQSGWDWKIVQRVSGEICVFVMLSKCWLSNRNWLVCRDTSEWSSLEILRCVFREHANRSGEVCLIATKFSSYWRFGWTNIKEEHSKCPRMTRFEFVSWVTDDYWESGSSKPSWMLLCGRSENRREEFRQQAL